MHSTTLAIWTPLPHLQRRLDELGRSEVEFCAVTMAPGPARCELRTELRPQRHALACHLATSQRSIKPPEAMADRSLNSFQRKLIQISPRVERHARAITFHLAEVAVSVGKQLVDSLRNRPIQSHCDGEANRSTRPAGAPSRPYHQPSAEVQQLEEMQ